MSSSSLMHSSSDLTTSISVDCFVSRAEWLLDSVESNYNLHEVPFAVA